MMPLFARRTEADGDPYQILERAGLKERADEIDRRGDELDDLEPAKSVICTAWIRYTRQRPDRAFGPAARSAICGDRSSVWHSFSAAGGRA